MDVGRALIRMGLTLLKPLQQAAEDPAAAAALVQLAGWDLDGVPGIGPDSLTSAARAVSAACQPVRAILDAQPDSGADLAAVGQALAGLGDAVAALGSLGDQWDPPPGLPEDLPTLLVGDLLGQLLVLQLGEHHPLLRDSLELLGVLVDEPSAPLTMADGAVVRAGGARPRVDLATLGRLCRQPGVVLGDRLGVGSSRRPADEVADAILPTLASLLRSAKLSAWYGDPGGAEGGLTDEQRQVLRRLLRVVWANEPAGDGGLATFDLAMALRDQDAATRAVVAYPTGSLRFSQDTPSWNAKVTLTGTLGGLVIRPDGAAFADGTPPDIHLTAAAERPPGGAPAVMVGASGDIGLALAGAAITLQAGLTAAGPNAAVTATLHGLRLVVGAPPDDGLLGQVLPANGLTAELDLTATWTPRGGLRLGGAAGLNATVPIGGQLGPVTVVAARLGIADTADGLVALATVNVALQLGPFAAVVDGLGLAARLTAPTGGGSLGPIDATVAVVPPRGIGLGIDAPAVSGGGFLALDADAGRYSGVFELTLLDRVSVKAIGIITTSLPDGRPGFALLLVITADGFTPVPLGLGFQLTGIGGLVALNRTVDADAVRGGLADGVLDSVLFVKDPTKNTARLLASLDRVFPPAPDRLVVGPLAEISWGNPPILHIRLALLLEVPQPTRAVLLAAVSVTLPDRHDPVVELHVDAIGVLDLGRGELALDASLHHSRLLGFTLSGDLALRLRWAAAPSFLLSVGGFHPRFPAPAALRPLGRVVLNLTSGDNPRVRLEAYLAVTSNSLQLGARVAVYAEAGGFGIDGGGSFDALVQWSPFHLDAAFQAWVRIFGPTGTLLAARVAVDISGPSPWRVSGVVELQVLFFTVRVGVDLSVGAAAPRRPVETVDVAALLWGQVGQPASWQATLAGAVPPGVTLILAPGSGADPVASGLVMHPLATLTLRQQVVPLATPISRMGARLPSDGVRSYHLDVTAPPGVRVEPARELFAPAQYMELAEDTKLSGPAFVPMHAGMSLRPERATAAAQQGVVSTEADFETLDVTELDRPARVAS